MYLNASYSPSSVVSGTGDIKIGAINYMSFDNGMVNSNQIENNLLYSVYLDEDVSKYFRNAIISEFKNSGFSVGSSERILSGNIRTLKYDDNAITEKRRWALTVDYSLRSENMKFSTVEVTIGTDMNTMMRNDQSTVLNKLIRMSYDDLLNQSEIYDLLTN